MSDATIAIRLVPRSGRDAIVGERDGRVLIRVAAPPVDGRANEAVRRELAAALQVRAGDVRIVRGLQSRAKHVEVDNPPADLAQRWSRLLSTVD